MLEAPNFLAPTREIRFCLADLIDAVNDGRLPHRGFIDFMQMVAEASEAHLRDGYMTVRDSVDFAFGYTEGNCSLYVIPDCPRSVVWVIVNVPDPSAWETDLYAIRSTSDIDRVLADIDGILPDDQLREFREFLLAALEDALSDM